MSQRARTTTAPGGRVSRPIIPGYGVPEETEGVLPWAHVAERLMAEKNYWVATADSKGRPHTVPVWAAWLDNRLYFVVGPRSARNLKANPAVAVNLESGTDVVILEGNAEAIGNASPDLTEQLIDAFVAKYDFRPETIDGWWCLQPSTIYAWTSFPADATRWRLTGSR